MFNCRLLLFVGLLLVVCWSVCVVRCAVLFVLFVVCCFIVVAYVLFFGVWPLLFGAGFVLYAPRC